MPILRFQLETAQGSRAADVPIDRLVIAGWTGRDASAVRHHIEELARLGVNPPSQVPLFYRAGAALLTQEVELEVLGARSSGEAEPMLFGFEGELWLTVGSDHTDRAVEAYSVAVSKQMCPKPVAGTAWRYREVAADWDRLRLCATIVEGARSTTYQEGTLALMRPPEDLLPRFTGGTAALPDGTLMSCGTLGAIGGVRAAEEFAMELSDPARGRRIAHRYRARPLPAVA